MRIILYFLIILKKIAALKNLGILKELFYFLLQIRINYVTLSHQVTIGRAIPFRNLLFLLPL